MRQRNPMIMTEADQIREAASQNLKAWINTHRDGQDVFGIDPERLLDNSYHLINLE